MNNLPYEILLLITDYLNLEDTTNFCLTSINHKQIYYDNTYWKHRAEEEFNFKFWNLHNDISPFIKYKFIVKYSDCILEHALLENDPIRTWVSFKYITSVDLLFNLLFVHDNDELIKIILTKINPQTKHLINPCKENKINLVKNLLPIVDITSINSDIIELFLNDNTFIHENGCKIVKDL